VRSRRNGLVVLIGLALLASACGEEVADTTQAPTTQAPVTTAPPATEPPPTTEAPAELLTDFGVDDTTIKIGLLADQSSGIFDVLVRPIVDASQAFWAKVNAEGGIAGGRTVELVVADTKYDPATHEQQYLQLRDEDQVAAIGQSTGSPQTAQIADELGADDMFAIPLSWYSGWAFDDNTLEQGYNYCFEAMNVVSFMNDMSEPGWTLAVASFPGEYGQDSAFGAKYAADQLGVEVLDLEGQVIPISLGGDPASQVAPALVQGQPDWVFATTGPSELAALMGAATQGGLQAAWSGSIPSYAPFLLTTPVAPIIDAAYYWPSTFAAYGTDVPGMSELVETISAAYPDGTYLFADYYVRGWVEALMMKQVLEAAFDSGDMTRAGILAAGQSIAGFDFQGLAPSQSYQGTPNDFAVRSAAIYDIDLAQFTPAATFSTGGNTGTVAIEGYGLDYVSDIAAGYDFTAPCFAG